MTAYEPFETVPSAYTDEQVQTYFDRIGLTTKVGCSKEDLNLILFHHITSVPLGLIQSFYHKPDFYNVPSDNFVISYQHGVAISLHPEDVFEKVVTQKREALCSEQVLLVRHILVKLGFQCKMVTGLVHDLPTGKAMLDRSHAILLVKFNTADKEELYFVDVGFGIYSPYSIIPFDNNESYDQHPEGNEYKIVKVVDKDFRYLLQVKFPKINDSWATLYSISTRSVTQAMADNMLKEGVLAKSYISVNNLLISIATPDFGTKQLFNHRLRIRNGDRVVTKIVPVLNEADRRQVLKEEFGVEFDEDVVEYLPEAFDLKFPYKTREGESITKV